MGELWLQLPVAQQLYLRFWTYMYMYSIYFCSIRIGYYRKHCINFNDSEFDLEVVIFKASPEISPNPLYTVDLLSSCRSRHEICHIM